MNNFEKIIKLQDKKLNLVYLGTVLSKDEIKEFSDELNFYGWSLYTEDLDNQIRMSEQEIINTVYIVLNNQFIQGVIASLLASEIYSVKNFIFKLWKKHKDKKIKKNSISTVEKEVDITVGFNARTETGEYIFKLNSKHNEEVIKESLDKAFDFFKTLEQNKFNKLESIISQKKENKILNYDEDNKNWVSQDLRDIVKEIQKRQKEEGT